MGVDRGQVKPLDAGANEMMNAPDSTADKCNGLRLLIWVETALLTSKTFTQTQSTNRSETVTGQVVIKCLMTHDKDKTWEGAKEKQNHTQRSQVKGGVELVLTVPLTGGGKQASGNGHGHEALPGLGQTWPCLGGIIYILY